MISRTLKVTNTTGPQRIMITFSHETMLLLAQQSDEQTERDGSRKTYSDLVKDAVHKTFGNNHHHDEKPAASPRASPKRKQK